MAKRRKTRAQKKLSDFRHNFTHSIPQSTLSTPVKFQFQKDLKIDTSKNPISTNSYPYLIKDLSKTAVLTLSILGAQLILYFLLTNHLFKIPGLNF